MNIFQGGMDWQLFGTVILASLIAGLGTGLGGLIAVVRRPGRRSFGLLMGIASGVMITLAFLELVNEAWELAGFLTATIGFAAGALFMFLVDFFVPHIRFGERETDTIQPPVTAAPARDNAARVAAPKAGHFSRMVAISGAADMAGDKAIFDSPYHGDHARQGMRRGQHGRRRKGGFRQRNVIHDHKLLTTGLLIAIGISIHNIPEGIAVGAGFMHMPKFGLFIALAIMLHNIPEGIAVAMPLCKSGVCPWDSFKAALFSGLAEPIGALIAVLFLASFEALIPAALAFAGGVMVFITLDELVPAAREHGHQHFTAIGIIMGAIFVFVLSGVFGV